ncbi:MAG: Gfo/Idh/MocA family protein [Chitinophagales bacterium]
MSKDSPILLMGAGSIGERHIRNLWQFGYNNISVFRQRNLPFRDIGDAKVRVLLDWEDVKNKNFRCAFICTPTSQHLDQALLCINENMHVFVEKPLSHNLDKFEELEAALQNKEIYFHVGYMLHFHPFLKQVKQWTLDETFGKLKTFETTWHSYLPDWHPWENYKTSYAARPEMGGGAALTLCHDVELMQWICGTVKQHETKLYYCKDLALEVDTGADVALQFDNVAGVCFISFCSKQEKREYNFSFQHAEIKIDYLKNEMKIKQENGLEMKTLPEFERNKMYIEQLKEFFTTLEKKQYSNVGNMKSLQKEEELIKICSPQFANKPVKNMEV